MFRLLGHHLELNWEYFQTHLLNYNYAPGNPHASPNVSSSYSQLQGTQSHSLRPAALLSKPLVSYCRQEPPGSLLWKESRHWSELWGGELRKEGVSH